MNGFLHCEMKGKYLCTGFVGGIYFSGVGVDKALRFCLHLPHWQDGLPSFSLLSPRSVYLMMYWRAMLLFLNIIYGSQRGCWHCTQQSSLHLVFLFIPKPLLGEVLRRPLLFFSPSLWTEWFSAWLSTCSGNIKSSPHYQTQYLLASLLDLVPGCRHSYLTCSRLIK